LDRTWRHLTFFQYETFLHARVTNGVVEGLNSKIKTAMKRAYGFKHVAHKRGALV
jgi:transposase